MITPLFFLLINHDAHNQDDYIIDDPFIPTALFVKEPPGLSRLPNAPGTITG